MTPAGKVIPDQIVRTTSPVTSAHLLHRHVKRHATLLQHDSRPRKLQRAGHAGGSQIAWELGRACIAYGDGNAQPLAACRSFSCIRHHVCAACTCKVTSQCTSGHWSTLKIPVHLGTSKTDVQRTTLARQLPTHLPNGHIVPVLLTSSTLVFKSRAQALAIAEWVVLRWQQAGLLNRVLKPLQLGRETGQPVT